MSDIRYNQYVLSMEKVMSPGLLMWYTCQATYDEGHESFRKKCEDIVLACEENASTSLSDIVENQKQKLRTFVDATSLGKRGEEK